MKIVFNNSQKLNEIVFANRNKSYGAYAIRAAYNTTVFKSLAIVSSTVFLFAIGAYVFTNIDVEKMEVYLGPNDPSVVVPVEIIPEKVDPPKTDPSGGKKTNSGPPIIVDRQDTLIEDPDPTPNPNPNPNGDPTATGTLTGTGTATLETTPTLTVAEVIEKTAFPEEKPEFEGGDAALRAFLARHILYPPPAREAGVEGTVYATFVIDESGVVESVGVLKGIGYGCDEESVRVIKLLPKFKKPGKGKNGKAVKTIFNIPIAFRLK